MAHVLATFGQFERRLIGQRTREALAIKRTEGVRLGRPRYAANRVHRRAGLQREVGLATAQGHQQGQIAVGAQRFHGQLLQVRVVRTLIAVYQ